MPIYCPNLALLYLDSTNLNNLDFIYDLPNLKILNAKESLCITEDIINHLKKNNINTNISNNDIIIQNKLEMIINEIIDPNMSEEEKVKTICLYVLENIEYNIDCIDESNDNPINFAFETNEGVCISYSYLTNALLKLSGIECYRVDNMTHVWNLVNIDDEYYYIDTSSMDVESRGITDLNKKLELNTSYMFDPTAFNNSNSTTTITNRLTIIPDYLKEEVLSEQEEAKNYICLEIIDLYLFRSFIVDECSYQFYSNTKDIVDCKKLSFIKK